MSTPIAKIDDNTIEKIIKGELSYLKAECESRYAFIKIYSTIDFVPIMVRAYSMELLMGEVSKELCKKYIGEFKDIVDKCREGQKDVQRRNNHKENS